MMIKPGVIREVIMHCLKPAEQETCRTESVQVDVSAVRFVG
jgi:hypothetical protein